MDNEPRYWFAARRYRWSCRLALTWEGWLIDVVWVVIFLAISPYVNERRHPWQSLGLIFGLIAIFLAIRHWKGEPQRWDD